MGKIIRREFVGNKLLFWLACVFGVTLPLGIIYLLEATITVEDEMEDPESFVTALREGKRPAR